MNRPFKVHLMGGEQTGWALDQDQATTRMALSELPDLVEFSSLKDADIVHTVWEEPLLGLDPLQLEGKRIICHVCNDVFKTFENAFMLNACHTVGLWVAISRQGTKDLTSLGLKNTYIPYTLDTTNFRPEISNDRLKELQQRYSIPKDHYVIGNFMRDTLGVNLNLPKPQKGAEIFFDIVTKLYYDDLPVHVLLAGPRRHWLINQFTKAGIPFSYAGKITTADDIDINILSQDEIGELYHFIDVNLVTSRWEGGPRCVLEGAATKTKVVSPAVGLAPDVLEPECIYTNIDSCMEILKKDIQKHSLDFTKEIQYKRLVKQFVPVVNISRFREVYARIEEIPKFNAVRQQSISAHRFSPGKRLARLVRKKIKSYLTGNTKVYSLQIALWHQFYKPPYGGGNQFMMALRKAMRRLGVKVFVNQAPSSVDVHICNSAWFDVKKFKAISRRHRPSIIHRVDGPIALYRGSTWDEDNRIYDINKEWASATVYQSGWCFKKMLNLNFNPVRPIVIHNAVDDRIFHRNGKIPFSAKRKVRLISTAWSDNPRKGGPFIKSLEEKLDWDRYEYTFVGNAQEQFENIRHIPPQNSRLLADTLRQHDIFIMASESEACSNALLEALSCGLPVLYLDDGGNGELVGFGGLPFISQEEALENLDRITKEYDLFEDAIYVDTIETIARRYLDLAERVMT